jgi:dethiobiotin synthetase
MTRGIAVTGTDTGVGKTVVACAIAAERAAGGARVRVFKPVETGVADPHAARDAHRLRDAARSDQSLEQISAFVFRDPVAPMVAAGATGLAIDLDALDRAFAKAWQDGEFVVVEGAGGLLVPVTRTVSFASLFGRWHLPIVIVAANRLGVINHVRLTARAADGEGLATLAVVLHDRPASEWDPSTDSNTTILSDLLPSVPILRFPWIDSVVDTAALADAARISGLVRLLDAPRPVADRDASRSPS